MTIENKNIITIDGPAGAGKGTLTKRLCEHYCFAGLDTGSLYRAVTLAMIEKKFNMDEIDLQKAIQIAKDLSDSHEILNYAKNPLIRSKITNKYVPHVAKIPEIRALMKSYQIDFGKFPPLLENGKPAKGAIIEGRDIGTVICPTAPIKFFITASPETRAGRRLKEYLDQGESASYQEVLQSIIDRDEQDRTRKTSPMIPADDAITIDTSENDKDETFEFARNIIDGKLKFIIE